MSGASENEARPFGGEHSPGRVSMDASRRFSHVKRAVAVVALAGAGAGAAFGLGSASTVVACATVSVEPQTIAVDTVPVATLPSRSSSECVTATVPTVTETTSTTLPSVTQTVTVTAPALTTVTPLAPAYEFVSSTGSDTCTRAVAPVVRDLAAGHVCRTYQRAYAVARNGDQIPVDPGVYASDNTGNAIAIDTTNRALTDYVTFTCAQAGVDTVDQSNQGAWNFRIRANWVRFTGPCFHFRILRGNSSGDSGVGSQHVQIVGAHIDSFQLSGVHDWLLDSDRIGPIIACYQRTEGNAAGRCSNYAAFPAEWQAIARWWAESSKTGTTGEQTEPYVHDRGNGSDVNQCTRGLVIRSTVFEGMQSADSNVMHQGGLLVDGGACQRLGLTDAFTFGPGNSVSNSMAYGIEMDGAMAGSLITGNWIGRGRGAVGTGGVLSGGELRPTGSALESGCRGGVHKAVDVRIVANRGDGYFTVNGNGDAASADCWSRVVVSGNYFVDSVFGGVACGGWNDTYTGVVYDSNSVFNRVCGPSGVALAARPTP